MGNKVSLYDNPMLSMRFKQAISKFEAEEVQVLEDTFKDLAKRSEGKTIDKQTFLRIFNLPGMLGERLFATFDIEHNGVINFAEFICGLGFFARGTPDQKIRFIFNMYDLTGDGKVSRTELETMLNSVVFAASLILENAELPLNSPHVNKLNSRQRRELKAKVSGLVSEAFQSLDADNKLSLAEFSKWIQHHPEILGVIDTAFSGDVSDQLDTKLAVQQSSLDSPHFSPMSIKDMLRPQSPVVRKPESVLRSHVSKHMRKFKRHASGIIHRHEQSRWGLIQMESGDIVGLHCPNCGLKIKVRFCYKCGMRLSCRYEAKLSSFAKKRSNSIHRSSSVSHISYSARSRARASSDSISLPRISVDSIDSADNADHSDCSSDNNDACDRNQKAPDMNGCSNDDDGSGHSAPGSDFNVACESIQSSEQSRASFGSNRVCMHRITGSADIVVIDEEELLMTSSSSISSRPVGRKAGLAEQFQFSERRNMWCADCGEVFLGGQIKFCMSCGFNFGLSNMPVEPKLHITSDVQLAENEISGWLMKLGRKFKRPKERWFVLRGKFLYQYSNPRDLIPSHTYFMQGCFIETVDHSRKNQKLKFGVEIIMSEETNQRKTFFAFDDEQRDDWIRCLRVHAGVHNFDEYYVRSEQELGRGRFAVVYACKSRVTGKQYAVKIVDKSALDAQERGNLRTELAVLKLVSDRHVLKLRNVFESRSHINIVMDRLQTDDLLDRIQERGRFSESLARKIMRNLLLAVQYLHTRGIVHRDLKPENIMMRSADRDDDIVVGDFGFSKFTLPAEIMSIPCGTIAYVAPEVLTLSGYGFPVDLWSAGIILYMLVSGVLPFYSDDTEVMIDLTIAGDVRFEEQDYWHAASDDVKDLITHLLRTDPEERIDAERALKHHWFALPDEQLDLCEQRFAERKSNGPANGDASYLESRHLQ